MKWLVVWGTLGLVGCAGSPIERMVAPEKAAAREDQYCQSLGASPGSERYQQCRMQLLAQAEMRHAAAMEGLSRAAASMQVPQSTTVNCTTTGPYGYRTTTCQ